MLNVIDITIDTIVSQYLFSYTNVLNIYNNYRLHFFTLRDLRESRNRCDSALYELHHKENEIRDIQKTLETSEGCKYAFIFAIYQNI